MDFNIGDIVRLKNEKGGGIITQVLPNKQLMVELEDGFEIPFLPSQLVPTGETGKQKNSVKLPVAELAADKKAPEKKEKPQDKFQKSGCPVLLICREETDDPESPVIKAHLVNDTALCFIFHASFRSHTKHKHLDAGILEQGERTMIFEIDRYEIQQGQDLCFEFIYFDTNPYTFLPPPVVCIPECVLAVDRLEKYVANNFLYEDAHVILIRDAHPQSLINIKVDEKVIGEKQELKAEKKIIRTNNPDIIEIDLHIHELLDDFKSLGPSEMLEVQMSHFRKSLDNELKLKQKHKKIVFIHGVGNGRLKMDLRKALDKEYSKLQYHDASFAEYGFGATMILL